MRSQRGAAGGGVALPIPVPLRQRQRRRIALKWMLDAVEKRAAGGRPFALRMAEEVVAVVEGRSGVWEKRAAVHRAGVAARANVGYKYKRLRRF